MCGRDKQQADKSNDSYLRTIQLYILQLEKFRQFKEIYSGSNHTIIRREVRETSVPKIRNNPEKPANQSFEISGYAKKTHKGTYNEILQYVL